MSLTDAELIESFARAVEAAHHALVDQPAIRTGRHLRHDALRCRVMYGHALNEPVWFPRDALGAGLFWRCAACWMVRPA